MVQKKYIFRGIDYDIGLKDYLQSSQKTGLKSRLNEKTNSLSTKDFTYRVINHWEKNNLIDSGRKSNRKWRRYSIMDLVWLYIIKELRSFGIGLELIQKVREFLSREKTAESEFPILEYYVSLVLVNQPVYLIIFPDGEAYPMTEHEFQINREYNSHMHHIQLNLNSIVQKVLPDKDLSPRFEKDFELNMDERKVIQMLRLGNFNEVNLTLLEGMDDKLEEEEFTVKERNIEDIIEHINNKKYKKIDLKKDLDFIISLKNED